MPALYHRTEVRFSRQTEAKLKVIQKLMREQSGCFVSMSEVIVRMVESILPKEDLQIEEEGVSKEARSHEESGTERK